MNLHERFKRDPSCLVPLPLLSRGVAIKMARIKLGSLTDVNMIIFMKKVLFFMKNLYEKGGGIVRAIRHYPKENEKYMHDYNK